MRIRGGCGRSLIRSSAGMGARSGLDGADVVGPLIFAGAGALHCVEAYELEYPVRFERFGLWQDSGGPGRWRGGVGVRRDIRVLTDSVFTGRATDRCRIPPPGAFGGRSGMGGGWVLNAGTDREQVLPEKVTSLPLRAGDVVTMLTSAGGGLGPAFERDPEAVRVGRGGGSGLGQWRGERLRRGDRSGDHDGSSRRDVGRPERGVAPSAVDVSRRLCVGIDIGGTFTDVVLADLDLGTLHVAKELTTAATPGRRRAGRAERGPVQRRRPSGRGGRRRARHDSRHQHRSRTARRDRRLCHDRGFRRSARHRPRPPYGYQQVRPVLRQAAASRAPQLDR